MNSYIKIISAIFLFFSLLQVTAQNYSNTTDRFPFEYNKRSKTPEVSALWEQVFLNMESKFMDKNNKIILHSYSSAPGKKAYNYKLSQDRGKAVKQFLTERGVEESRISIQPHGEPPADNYGDEDYSGDRDVLPVFKKIPPKAYTDNIDKYRNKATLEKDIEEGGKIFQELVGPDIDRIKKQQQMVRKVFIDNPSADPEELLTQVKDILKEMKEIKTTADLTKFAAKIGLDAFIDLFTSLDARKINIARQIKYDIIKEALTAECFPLYKVDNNAYNFEEKLLFYSLKLKMSRLSDHDKYKLRAFFIAGKTFELYSFPADWRYEHKMKSAAMFKRNLDNWFNQSANRYRD